MILERCVANSMEWACTRGLQFDMPTWEDALFLLRWRLMKHLRPKLTAKITVRNRFIRVCKLATHLLRVWMAANLLFQEHLNWCMMTARAAETGLWTITKTHVVVPESIRAVQVVYIQAVTLCRSNLFCHSNKVGRWDNLQRLLNQQARSIFGPLHATPRGASMREWGLSPTGVILDSRQQHLAARLAYPCSSKLKELHKDPSSGTQI